MPSAAVKRVDGEERPVGCRKVAKKPGRVAEILPADRRVVFVIGEERFVESLGPMDYPG